MHPSPLVPFPSSPAPFPPPPLRYVGPIRYARNLEALAELYIHLELPMAGFTKECWGKGFAFQVIERP